MKHVIFLFYIFAFSAGVSSLSLSVFIYIKHRIEIIKYCTLFLLTLNINAGIIISYTYTAAFYPEGASLIFPVLFKCSLIISTGLILYPVFILVINSCRASASKLKKLLLGLAVFLTPNLVFSNSHIRGQLNEKINLVDSGTGIKM